MKKKIYTIRDLNEEKVVIKNDSFKKKRKITQKPLIVTWVVFGFTTIYLFASNKSLKNYCDNLTKIVEESINISGMNLKETKSIEDYLRKQYKGEI